MKKKLLSLALAAAITLSWVPAVSAADSQFDFSTQVVHALPVPVPGQLLDNSMELPDPESTGFLAELSGTMPSIRPDGFLAEPTAPLNAFPAEGQLLEAVGEPNQEAIEISDAAGLQAMADGGNYVLTADIDLSGVAWTPIDADSWDAEAPIILDGQGHTISGLTAASPGYGGGLFGQISVPLTVRNLILKDFSVPAPADYSGVGALVGMTSGSLLVENVVVDNFQVGGGTSSLDKNPDIGGLFGYASDAVTIRACAVTGKVNCAPNEDGSTPFTPKGTGGLAGYVLSSSTSITDCITDVDIDLTSTFTSIYSGFSAGGLVGYLRSSGDSSLLRCAASGDVLGNKEDVDFSGLVGYAKAGTTFSMTDCLFNGTLTAGQGGLVSTIDAPSTAIRNCRFEGTLPASYAKAATFGGIAGSWYEYCNVTSCIIENCLNTSDMSFARPASLYSSTPLAIGGLVGQPPALLTMTGCLNTGALSCEENKKDSHLGGLVGNLDESADIRFTRCENQGTISGYDNVGGLVGYQAASATNTPPVFTDCRNTGDITITAFNYNTNGYAGGLLGYGSCEMVNCVNTGDISGRWAGGLLGYNERNSSVRFEHCRSTCTLTGISNSSYFSAAGGLVGYVRCETAMEDCAANVTVTLADGGSCSYAGGLVGQVESNLSLLRCSAIANLPSAKYSRGGLVGHHASSAVTTLSLQDCHAVLTSHDSTSREVNTGGLVGYSDEGITADNCAADVNLTIGPKCNAGGLVGRGNAVLTRCCATGSILSNSAADLAQSSSNSSKAGGLVGYSSSATLGQCYSGVDIDDCTYMGGLMGDGSGTVYSSWSDATLSGPGSLGYAGGLIGHINEGTDLYAMQDCTFLGRLSCAGYQAVGGLVGSMSSYVDGGLMYNCYYRGTVQGDDYAGGLLGQGKGTFRFCRFNGSVSGSGSSGGIVGAGSGTLEFHDCHTTGSAAGREAGGIVGKGYYAASKSDRTYLYDCTSSSSIGTCSTCSPYHTHYLGGLAGYLYGSMTDCRALGRLSIGSAEVTAEYIGGLAGFMTGTLSNCSISSTPYITGTGAKTQYLGGLAGYHSGSMVDCTSRGIYVNRRGATNFSVGGLIGAYKSNSPSYNVMLDNCRVEGDVFANSVGTQDPALTKPATEYYQVGGLFGGGASQNGGNVWANSCVVAGDVTLYRTVSYSNTASLGRVPSQTYAGGYGGYGWYLYVDNCRFEGTRIAPTAASTEAARLLGYSKLVYAEVPGVTLPEEDEEQYTVTVKLMDYAAPTVLYTKAGVPVYVNGVHVGDTDENGVVKFGSSKVKAGSLVKVSASLEGYFDSTTFTYLADGGSTLLVLKQLQPGQIYIKSARYLEEGSSADLLSYLTDLRVLNIDDNFKKVRFEVEWSNSEPEMRTLYLADEEGNFVASLNDGEVDYIQFAQLFQPGTDIYAVAEAYFKNEDGSTTEVTAKELLSIRVEKLRPRLDTGHIEKAVSSGSGEEKDGPYFLKGLNWAMGFDDMGPFAGEMSLKNGYLNLKFAYGEDFDYEIPMWKVGSADGQVGVAIEGTAAIPYIDTYTGEWTANLGIVVNDVPDLDLTETSSIKYGYSNDTKGIFNMKYPFLVKIPCPPHAVPCFLDIILDAGGSARLQIAGPYDAVDVIEGTIDVQGYGDIYAGVGGEFEDTVALKFGGEGEIQPKFHMVYNAMGGEDEADWELSGMLSLKALVKFLETNISGELQLGTFKWDGEKTTWTLFGNELGGDPGEDSDGSGSGGGFSGDGDGGGGSGSSGGRSIQLLDDSTYQPLSRSYLANGGGFATHDVSSFTFSPAAGGSLRYDNAGEVSEAALAVENDTLVLYFTADDGAGGTTGSVGSHTVLWRSELLEDGSWSTPAALTTTESGFPAAVHADGPYAIWEQASNVTTEDAAALLASTDIQVSAGGKDVHTFELEGYDYAPKVSASSDGAYALACWLHVPSLANSTAEQDAIQLWYATYNGTAWSDPAQLTTTGTPVSFFPDKGSNYIYYRTADGTLYRQSPSTWSSASSYFTGLSGRTVMCNGMAASFAEDGTLTIRSSSYGTVTRSTNYVRGQDVAMVYANSTYYLFWPEAEGIRMMKGTASNVWSEPLLLTATDALPEQLSAAVADGVPHVSWYQRTTLENGTHKMDLYTTSANLNGVDLVLQNVTFDRNDLLDTGLLTIQGDVYNNGLTAASSITVTIADENAESTPIYTHTFTKSVPSGGTARFNATIAPSPTATTYTVTATPNVADADAADNTLDLAFDDVSARIMDASFLADGTGGVELQALVRNDGLLPLADLTVEVSDPSGTVLTTTSYGSMTDIPIGSYRQVVLADAQPDTYYTVTASSGETVLDSTMLYYADPDAVTLSATELTVTSDGAASLRLSGQNHEAAAKQLLLALYRGGQMLACGTADVSSLNGKQSVTFRLADALETGDYDYKLFFLSDDAALTPYTTAKTGTVSVSA